MFIQKLLIPFGILHSRVMDARNAFYDRGFFRVHDLGARTISVGNLTTGGTGKTPLVALIAKIFAEQGETVCILTRGYGRKNAHARVLVSDGETVHANAETGGDEPVELARKLVGIAIVIADADRVAAGVWAKEKFGVTAFILDDGFQHRRVKRDLDIVCIDATNPFGGGNVLPAGRLREPLENLKRADVVVVTRANLVNSPYELMGDLGKRNAKVPIFQMSTTISALSKLEDFLNQSEDKEDRPAITNAFAFCGLGNPDNFQKMLEQERIVFSGFKALGDHKRYAQADIHTIEDEARSTNSNALLTTAKDAVKLSGLEFKIPVFVVEIESQIDDIDGFKKLLISS